MANLDALHGRAAIVTGASRERGAAVLVAHWGEPALADETVARIRAAGGVAEPFEADCSDVAANRAVVARAVAAFGRLDVFVANAGLTVWGPFLEYTEASWDTV